MSRIREVFQSLDGVSCAYIPYVCAGDPSSDFTVRLVRALCESGADLVELGLPFSDPIADGPTIQGAMMRSLNAGFRVNDIFRIISDLRRAGVDQPIVLMTYSNPVMRMGWDRFCEKLSSAGADGILVVDLPPEESAELEAASGKNSLDVIRLVAPSTSEERLDEILARSTGYVYAVSVSGVTGARSSVNEAGLGLVMRAASRKVIPVALGFGVSRPEHVRMAVSAGASGVIEGSALISAYSQLLPDEDAALSRVAEHVREMKSAGRR
jgi:tryptophan synthase alpha chain